MTNTRNDAGRSQVAIRAARLSHAHGRSVRVLFLKGSTPNRIRRVESLSALWRAAHKHAVESYQYLMRKGR